MYQAYTFLSHKGRNNPFTDFWTPLFDGTTFLESSYPANRKNRAFEIRGLTLTDPTITSTRGTFVIKNNMIAVFNSKEVLVEIVGGITEDDILNLIAFNDIWTPLTFPGKRLYWDSALGEDTTFITRSNNGYTVTTLANNDVAIDKGTYFSNTFADPGNIVFGIPFQISNITSTNEFEIVGLTKRTGKTSYSDIVDNLFISFGYSVNSGFVQVKEIGNNNGSIDTINKDITWDSNTIYILAYVPPVISGTLGGAIRLYTNNTIPTHISNLHNNGDNNNFVLEKTLAVAIDSPIDCLSIYQEVVSGYSVSATIKNDSTYIATGVTIVSGGLFDEESYPFNIAGRAITVSGLGQNTPVYINEIGNIYDGDMLFFNALGDIQGRPWGREQLLGFATVDTGVRPHVSEHVLAYGEDTVTHTHLLENIFVIFNGGILLSSDYTFNPTNNTVTLVTPVQLVGGAEVSILTLNTYR